MGYRKVPWWEQIWYVIRWKILRWLDRRDRK